jgi:hypothetical protein
MTLPSFPLRGVTASVAIPTTGCVTAESMASTVDGSVAAASAVALVAASATGPFHPAPSRAASRPKFALQAFRTGCVEFNGSENQEGANRLNVRKPVARLVS